MPQPCCKCVELSFFATRSVVAGTLKCGSCLRFAVSKMQTANLKLQTGASRHSTRPHVAVAAPKPARRGPPCTPLVAPPIARNNFLICFLICKAQCHIDRHKPNHASCNRKPRQCKLERAFGENSAKSRGGYKWRGVWHPQKSHFERTAGRPAGCTGDPCAPVLALLRPRGCVGGVCPRNASSGCKLQDVAESTAN